VSRCNKNILLDHLVGEREQVVGNGDAGRLCRFEIDVGLDAIGDPVFCTLWTLTGLPAVNLPLLAGTDDSPIGVQLVDASGRDERLLRTACELVRMVAEEG
jgi:hypothetical protein